MKRAQAIIYLDINRPNRVGKCCVKIRVTYNRIRKYYSTGYYLLPKEFNQIMNGMRRDARQYEIKTDLDKYLNKANEVIRSLTAFNFDDFKIYFLDKRNANISVSFAFDEYIKELISVERLGTASSYQCAINSFEKFKKNLTFGEITATFLYSYETWMIKKNRSITTVGFYVRCLRAIYNLQNFPHSMYPFGLGKNKYKIPSPRNIKKALSIEEINTIYSYPAKANSAKDRAKDYWIFLYLTGGMNVKDFCMLKWSDIEDSMITYQRAKTKSSTSEKKLITLDLKKEAIEIIKKWSQPSIVDDSYIFPHLRQGMSAVQQRNVYQSLTKRINKHVKEIAKELEINKNVTTYVARHSFATVLKRAGAKTEMISELLGHSSTKVTENYLAGFEVKQIKQATKALTAGF
tara:strand:+ start:572 stop:1786 length:1215 start_codon:yes stop_codon:yes gene_type:complete